MKNKEKKCEHYWEVTRTINILPGCETFDLIVQCRFCKIERQATGSID